MRKINASINYTVDDTKYSGNFQLQVAENLADIENTEDYVKVFNYGWKILQQNIARRELMETNGHSYARAEQTPEQKEAAKAKRRQDAENLAILRALSPEKLEALGFKID